MRIAQVDAESWRLLWCRNRKHLIASSELTCTLWRTSTPFITPPRRRLMVMHPCRDLFALVALCYYNSTFMNGAHSRRMSGWGSPPIKQQERQALSRATEKAAIHVVVTALLTVVVTALLILDKVVAMCYYTILSSHILIHKAFIVCFPPRDCEAVSGTTRFSQSGWERINKQID